MSRTGFIPAAAAGAVGYRLLEHATDAIVEVEAESAGEAFADAGRAVRDITLDAGLVEPSSELAVSAEGHDWRHLLFDWLEAVTLVLITDGFAVSSVDARLASPPPRGRVEGIVRGEPLDVARHGFKVEIKAPTFHEMEVDVGEGRVKMRFLLDL